MPLNDRLDFTAKDLFVRYRASDKPQQLDVEVRTSGQYKGDGGGASRLVNAMMVVGQGAAGDAQMAPWQGAMEYVSGGPDVQGPGSGGPHFRWTLRVTGLCPKYMRVLVEDLRLVARENTRVTFMSIQGSEPMDLTDMSVNERSVNAWLDDPAAYPARWPKPGFPIKENLEQTGKGAAFRLDVDGGVSPEIRRALDTLSSNYMNALFPYLSANGAPSSLRHIIPICASAKTEYRAVIPIFPWVREPALDLLVNLLARFHHDVAPIVEAEIWM
jgi:hypothetical protein